MKDRASNNPIAFATVALMMEADSSIVTGITTGEDGTFQLQDVKPGSYLAQVSFLGYEKAYRNASVPKQGDLGEILLEESANKLNEVLVVGNRPFVERRVDRYVVNVGSHIMTAGRNALDVLRNTPGVLVQSDGSITVAGNVAEIWMDGRPSNLSGDQLKALLTSTQGETIDRIEVITNPSSRYDAAGAGGIVNIRSKKSLQYGINGSVNAGYVQSRVDVENAGLQLNFRNERLNLFGNYGTSRHNGTWDLRQTNTIETPEGMARFDEHSVNKTTKANITQQLRAGVDFFLSPQSTLGFLVNGYENGKSNRTTSGQTQITPAYEGVDHTAILSHNTDEVDGVQFNANYVQTFRLPGRQLNIDVDYGRFNSAPSQHISNTYYNAANGLSREPEQLHHANPQSIDIYSAKSDYTQPLSEKLKLETGLKYSRSKTDNDLRSDVWADGQWEADRERSNRFVYSEQIYAAYLNLLGSWGKWNAQAGLRGEYTLFKGEQHATGAANDSSYLNLFPTLYVTYRPGQYTLGISYSRRLRRPGYAQLNPFELKTGAYSYYEGNPYLTPNYRHMIEVNYANRHNLMINLTYNLSTDLVVSKPVAKDGVRYGTRPVNFGERINFGGGIYYSFSLLKWWSMFAMIDAAI